MSNYRMNSEEEALFRSYPYALYFVQSPPSAISHATNNNYDLINNLNYNNNNNSSPILALSRYSSSRGSNDSILKKYSQDDQVHLVLENGEIKKDDEIMKNNGVESDDQEYGYDEKNRGWIKYFSFSYNSSSAWWILMQLSWRFLLSLMIALVVFYVAVKPPAPKVSIKIAGIRQFRLGEGVDGSGVTTKILSCNCSMDLIIDNHSKLFGLHINPPIMELFFGHFPFAMSQMDDGELYGGIDDSTLFKLNVGTRNKAMYSAGRNMQDLLESGKGLPLVVRMKMRSSFHVVWGLFEPKFHHQAQCLVVLADKYDKKHRTQVYNSTCIINS